MLERLLHMRAVHPLTHAFSLVLSFTCQPVFFMSCVACFCLLVGSCCSVSVLHSSSRVSLLSGLISVGPRRAGRRAAQVWLVACVSMAAGASVSSWTCFYFTHPPSSSSFSVTFIPAASPSPGAAHPWWAADSAARQPGDLQPGGDHWATPTQVPPANRVAHPPASVLEGESAGRRGGRHHQPAPPLQRHR